MKLTDDDKRKLEGEYGTVIAHAMRFLADLGEAFDAEEMIDLDFAHVYTIEDYRIPGHDKTLLAEALEENVKCVIPATAWISGFEMDENIYRKISIDDEKREKIQARIEVSRRLGITCINTCAPYIMCDQSTPSFGAHIASIESSAVSYFNSALGIRCNRDGISALFGAFTGRYPNFGMHLDENRKGRHLFKIEAELKNTADYSAAGYHIGEICGLDVPVVANMPRPSTEEMQGFCSALAVSGAVSLAHIVGVTPEAPTEQAAFQGGKPERTYHITNNDLDSVYEKYNSPSDKVDFICLGCPHMSIHDIRKYSELLKGKKVRSNVTVWLMSSVQNIYLAKQEGYIDILEQAGVTVLTTCPINNPGIPGPNHTSINKDYSIGNFATNSMKLLYYSRNSFRPKKTFFGSTEQCIQAAVSGTWEC